MLALAVILAAALLLFELYRAYTIRQSVEVELSRAVNTAVDLAMSDLHRQDHLSELNAGEAYAYFYQYLHENMALSGDLRAYDARGGELYALRIDALDIERSPPNIRVRALIALKPAFLGGTLFGEFTLPVRGRSINRRKD
jgi:hypothetical protein